MDPRKPLGGLLGYLLEAFGVPLGGLLASWGSPWRLWGPLGHYFGGLAALLGTSLELSGASWGPFLRNCSVSEWIRHFCSIYVVIFVMFVVCLGYGMIDRVE